MFHHHLITIAFITNIMMAIVIMTMIILIIRNDADIYGGTNSCFMAVITNTAATRSLFFRHRRSFSIIIKEIFLPSQMILLFLMAQRTDGGTVTWCSSELNTTTKSWSMNWTSTKIFTLKSCWVIMDYKFKLSIWCHHGDGPLLFVPPPTSIVWKG